MIFFGIKAGLAGTCALPGTTCQHCLAPNSVAAVLYSRYFHIYWIPVFPIGLRGLTLCSFCKQALEPPEMPADYQAAKAQVKVPLRHFAGCIILALTFAWLLVTGGL